MARYLYREWDNRFTNVFDKICPGDVAAQLIVDEQARSPLKLGGIAFIHVYFPFDEQWCLYRVECIRIDNEGTVKRTYTSTRVLESDVVAELQLLKRSELPASN